MATSFDMAMTMVLVGDGFDLIWRWSDFLRVIFLLFSVSNVLHLGTVFV